MTGQSFPVPANETERLAAVRELQFLYVDQRESLQRIHQLALRTLEVPYASVNLVDADTVLSLSSRNRDQAGIPRSSAISSHVIMQDGVFEVPNIVADPQFANSFGVNSEPGFRSFLGMPLAMKPGVNVGVFCVLDTKPRRFTENEKAEFVTLGGIALDVIRLHKSSRDLQAREAMLNQTTSLAQLGGWERDLTTGRFKLSDQLYRINELDPGDPRPMRSMLLGLSTENDRKLRQAIDLLARSGTPFDIEVPFTTAWNNRRWARVKGEREARNGKVVRVFGVVQDITDRKAAEARIEHLAHHDSLTGLPNRALFNQRLAAAIEACKASNKKFALMLLDFDDFKSINDTRGHAVGDRLLETAATRLLRTLGPGDTVSRLGGDEFAVIVNDVETDEDVTAAAERICAVLKEPLPIGNESIATSVSIGVTMFPDDHSDGSELMKNADIALYLAKSAGRARPAYFTPALRSKFEEKRLLIEDIRRGIAANEFMLYYQPICGMSASGANRVAGFESLMRWHHPRLGVLTPAFFNIGFEDAQLALQLGEVGLKQLIHRIEEWHAAGVPFGYVAFNVAPGQFANSEFFAHVRKAVSGAGVPRGSVMLEVTESVYLSQYSEKVAAELSALHDIGVRVALDDFGTGYASLTHLKQFPIDIMKIDRSFIRHIGENQDDTAIACAVINLGHALGIDIVAEGVEKREQAQFLSLNGCNTMQGYYFAKAMHPDDVPAFIRSYDRAPAVAGGAAT
jgi:diguanylate cyclase (GGDEF)-like protein